MCVHVYSYKYTYMHIYTGACLYMIYIIYVYCDMLPFPGTFIGIGRSVATKTQQNYWPHGIHNFLQKDRQ